MDKDEKALQTLYDRYERRLYSFAIRLVREDKMAEDIVRELFVRIWRAAERYDPGCGELSSWLFRILRLIAGDWIRLKEIHASEPFNRAGHPAALSSRSGTESSDGGSDYARDSAGNGDGARDSARDGASDGASDGTSDSDSDDDRGRLVRLELDKLEEAQQAVIELIYYDGCSQHQAAHLQSVPLPEMRVRIRETVNELQRRLVPLGRSEEPR
jgi:RNA polymerase sigma factor (sigma-70 family)